MVRSFRTIAFASIATVTATAGCGSVQRSAAPSPSPAVSATDGAIGVAPGLFEFHSAFWVNLHHFLYVRARAEQGRDAGRATVTTSLADTAGLDARSAGEQAAWAATIRYYAAEMAGRDPVFDSALIETKTRLTRLGNAPSARDAGLGDDRLTAALEAAAPVYRAVWWARHDAANRAWVTAMLPLLARHGDVLARQVTRGLGSRWPTVPIRVDVAPYTNWAGAYTTERPSHIMISSTAPGYTGSLGLEMLYHEASHTLEDSVALARQSVAEETGKRVPYDVVHAIIFYNAGEVTRRTVPGHVPYIVAQGLRQGSGGMSRYYPILDRYWGARLDGTASLLEVMRSVVRDQ